ncbi:2387_t:CDS:2 [Entrophospora sp. SA101]|nr:2387_t:CDS:2 [Entrophospora sp. SA101]CAJ0864558.1 3740_t:CDS:2 [Entrophospora sp. SA101]
MPLSLISPSENDFILKGVDDNIRADGRGRLDYRHVDLETGVIPQASGSARCRLGVGTDVLVGVKIEIGAIEIDGNYEQVVEIKSKRGRVVCSVECSPIASQQFAGRGAEDINNELTQTIERIFNGPQGGLNLEKLCIIPGQQCWVVYIDAMVLDYAGNLSDTIFITTRAALYNARVPKTTIQDHGDGEIEVDISEDVEEWERIYGWDMVPIGTDVLVGVKIEIGAIEIDGNYEQVVEIKSKRGRVVCSVECSPIASQQFAGRGAEDINNELTQTIERIFNGPQGGLNLEKLCIIPGQQCWVVYIDAMVLDYAGNLSDTIFITTRAALYNARVPKTTIQDHGDGEIEVDISEDVEEWERIYGWDMVPIGVTLNRIGARHIVDATPLEELATETKLLVTVNKMGKICGIQKSGSGCIEPSLLKEMVQTGRTIGLGLIDSLDSMLKQEEEEINKKHARREPIDQLGFFATT